MAKSKRVPLRKRKRKPAKNPRRAAKKGAIKAQLPEKMSKWITASPTCMEEVNDNLYREDYDHLFYFFAKRIDQVTQAAGGFDRLREIQQYVDALCLRYNELSLKVEELEKKLGGTKIPSRNFRITVEPDDA